MLNWSILLALFIFVGRPAYSQDQLEKVISFLDQKTITPAENCPHKTKDLKVISDEKVPISILSIDELNKAFDVLKKQKDIPFKYKRDGCFARAHKMVRVLDSMGIESGKFFAEGKLVPSNVFKKEEEFWSYHVAPFVFVEEKGLIKMYILDPSLGDAPMRVADWMKAMKTTPNASIIRTYATRKQNVLPKQKYRKQTFYSQEDDVYVEEKLAMFRKELE